MFGSWDQQSAPQQAATPNPSADPFGGDAFASQTKASLAGFLKKRAQFVHVLGKLFMS